MAYVKFLQGTRAQYDGLSVKDSNTLYFIKGDDDSVVSLYLGERFVSGVDHLANLKDAVLETVSDKDVLIYDAVNAKWKNLSFENLLADIEANIEHQHLSVDTSVFELGEDNILKLVGFENAEAGAMLSKTTDGKATWIIPSVDLSEIANEIAALEQDLTTAEGQISNLEDRIVNVYNKTEVDNFINELESSIARKADATNVYTKNEVYTKIEVDNEINEAIVTADHLRRKVVASLGAINVNAEDALMYIYMVPTGTVYGDDKYDEYLVIEDEGVRKAERVGSWEVDLTSYAKVADVNTALANKADKATTLAGYGITDAYTKEETLTKIEEKITEVSGGESAGEVLSQLNSYKEINDAKVENLETKVATLEEGAEVNVIDSVSNDFTIDENRQLQLNNISIAKVSNLESILAQKVDAVEGYALISTANVEKLAKIEEGAQVNFIDSVNESYFTVSEVKTLNLSEAFKTRFEAVESAIAWAEL